MKEKINKIITLLILVSLFGFGQKQDVRWYLDKPNTKADTIAIIKNKIKYVSKFFADSDSLYESNRQAYFYFHDSKLDSVKIPNYFPVDRTIEKVSDDKIIETITMKPGATKNSNTVCRRIHYLNKEGQIIKTENKILKGLRLEGEAYAEIQYNYKDGLLSEAIIWGGGRTSVECQTIKFKYEQNLPYVKRDSSSVINLRGYPAYYVDGFKVYPNLTETEKNKILKEFISKLNGYWISDSTSELNVFKLSTETFSGTWLQTGSSTKLKTRIELTNALRIINSDLNGSDMYPGLLVIFGTDKLNIDFRDKNGLQTFTRQNNCQIPNRTIRDTSFKVNDLIEMPFPTYCLGRTCPDGITVDSYDSIAKVAIFIKKYPQYVFQIETHTDQRGYPAKNKTLSEIRANLFKKILIENNKVDSTSILAKGLGETMPINSQKQIDAVKTKEEKENLYRQNRRTALRILRLKVAKD